MEKNTLFSLLVAGACCFTSESQAAVVLTVDPATELLSFSGTTQGNDQEISPEDFPGFSVIEWESTAPSGNDTLFALDGYLVVDASSPMNFIRLSDGGVTISFQFDNTGFRNFLGTNAVLDYSSATPDSKINLAALAGSSLAVTYGHSELGAVSVVEGDLSVPEPASALLAALGGGLALIRRRRA